MKKVILISLALILADQLTKSLVISNLSFGESMPVIKNILHLTFIRNTGAVFGILQNSNPFLIWITFIVIGFILFYLDKISYPNLIFAAMILSGAIGNLIDRIRLGYVIDFIDFRFWPAFNVADSLITIGVIGLIILSFRNGIYATNVA